MRRKGHTISGVTFFGRKPKTAEGDGAPPVSLVPGEFPSAIEFVCVRWFREGGNSSEALLVRLAIGSKGAGKRTRCGPAHHQDNHRNSNEDIDDFAHTVQPSSKSNKDVELSSEVMSVTRQDRALTVAARREKAPVKYLCNRK